MEDFCRRLPKAELHAHLNGSISPSTIQKLLCQNSKLKDLEGDGWRNATTVAKGTGSRTLDECFKMFKLIHRLVEDEAAVRLVASDVVQEFASEGVVYLELRSTPRANPQTGLTKRSYVAALLEGIDDGITACDSSITVNLLLSIDRRQGALEAMDTVELALEMSQSSNNLMQHRAKIVGIDLSGDPSVGDVEELLPALKRAREGGLKLSLHVAEVPDRNEEARRLVVDACPDRIGHGTFLHPQAGGAQDLVDCVLQKKLPLEICLTSNIKCQTVPDYSQHHLAFWLQCKHPVAICTDDKGVFSTSLSEEYAIAADTFSLGFEQLWSLAVCSLEAAFADGKQKEQLKETFTKMKPQW